MIDHGTLFKVLGADGSPVYGTGRWSLPTDKPGGWMPNINGELVPCERGYHLARGVQVLDWLGPRLFVALSPCPPGWDVEPEWSVELARLAVQTGIWPLKEALHGAVAHTQIPARRKSVEEYLSRQGRFRHLFEPRRNDEAIALIQAGVDRYWEGVAGTQPSGSAKKASNG